MPLARTPLASPGAEPAAATSYRERAIAARAEREALQRRSNAVANGRLVVALAAVITIGWAVLAQSALLLLLTGVPLAVFVALVVAHARLEHRQHRLEVLERLNTEGALRALRRWPDLAVHHRTRAPADHAYANDLDLFGRASLFHLLDVVGNTPAEDVLADWLLAPAPLDEACRRQEAVRELAPQVDLRERLALMAHLAAGSRSNLAALLDWAEGSRWLAHRRWLLLVGRGAVVVLWVAGVAQLLGLIGWPIWLPALGVTLLLATTVGREATRRTTAVRGHAEALRWAAEGIAVSLAAGFRATRLVEATAVLCAAGRLASQEIASLSRLANAAIPPSAVLSPLIQALTLWDLNVLDLLEGWQRRCGAHVRGWLRAQAEIEALAALAGLAADNPDWTFPALRDDLDRVTGRAVGHPLLPDGARVANDVDVGPPGTFLLVTGSNMAGKSTYLRSIGLNVVLGLAGGPVCARELALPALQVWTSMRVQDSLEHGVSLFLAELVRIKQVIDAAASAPPHQRVLYLLDEILLGTNTAERQIAVRQIIAHLIACGAIGAVSTHDLTLATVPDLASAARCVHFREEIGVGADGPVMRFEYRLRPGLATSTNALRLMELIGVPTPEARP